MSIKESIALLACSVVGGSLLTSVSSAGVTNCQNLFVGQILIQNGVNFRAFFLDNPGDASGSQWVYFNHWNAEDKKAALSMLLAAKMAQHRVILVTEEPGGCDIVVDQRLAKSVYLQTAP